MTQGWDGTGPDEVADAAAKARQAADFASWAADAEAERATLLAAAEADLRDRGVHRRDILARAAALRGNRDHR